MQASKLDFVDKKKKFRRFSGCSKLYTTNMVHVRQPHYMMGRKELHCILERIEMLGV